MICHVRLCIVINHSLSLYHYREHKPAFQLISNRRSSEIQGTALGKCLQAWPVYWAIQAGLLTPLTFARLRLSPLAAFTAGAYFLHNRDNGSDSEFANFTLPTLNAFLEARSHNVSGNKQ